MAWGVLRKGGEEEQVSQLQPGRMPMPRRPDQGSETAPDQSRSAPSVPSAPSVLAILAHPSDEIMIAPVLARVARNGGEVAVAFATSGEAGATVNAIAPGASLAAMREDEARCSAFAMGLPEPAFWQFGDSSQGADESASSARDAETPALTQRIAALISLHSPQVVITWEPEAGLGDPDHARVSRASIPPFPRTMMRTLQPLKGGQQWMHP